MNNDKQIEARRQILRDQNKRFQEGEAEHGRFNAKTDARPLLVEFDEEILDGRNYLTMHGDQLLHQEPWLLAEVAADIATLSNLAAALALMGRELQEKELALRIAHEPKTGPVKHENLIGSPNGERGQGPEAPGRS